MKQLFIISDKSTLVTDKLEKRLKNDLIENNKKASQNMELIKQSITYNSEESLNGYFSNLFEFFYLWKLSLKDLFVSKCSKISNI